jgi:hypothetical protein
MSPRLAPAIFALTLWLAACGQDAQGPWDSGTVVLLVSQGAQEAEVVFEKNEFVRIDSTSTDAAFKDEVRARVEQLVAEAKVQGLHAKWHADDEGQERGALVGASPKPGEPHFARAMYHHLGHGDGFNVRAK